MVDWMIEIVTKFECSINTFFLSVHILDTFLKRGPSGLDPEDLLIVGAMSIVIASKFEDVEAIGIDVAQKCIVHGKHSVNDLVEMEVEMLRIIEFDCFIQLPTDFLGQICSVIRIPFVVVRTAELILFLNRLEYNNYWPPFEEAIGALIVACQSLKQHKLASSIFSYAQISEEILEISVIGIRSQLFSYKINPPRYKFVFHYLRFTMESAESSKIFRFCDKDLETAQLNLINS
jgi:hypothetical protein